MAFFVPYFLPAVDFRQIVEKKNAVTAETITAFINESSAYSESVLSTVSSKEIFKVYTASKTI